jgi:hypothetical protein
LVDRTRRKPWTKTRNHPKANGEQRYFNEKIGYITPGYFKEEPGISPLDISMKNRVYHP